MIACKIPEFRDIGMLNGWCEERELDLRLELSGAGHK